MTDESIQIHFALPQPFAGKERSAFPFHRLHHRRRGGSQPGLRRQPIALFLVLVVTGVCLLGLGRWLYQSGGLALAQETGRKYLQALRSSPKFNFTSAPTPQVKDRQPAQLPAPTGEPPVVERVRLEVLPPPELPIAAEPPRPLGPVDPVDPLDSELDAILAYSSTLAPHRGDSPMLRTWKLLELAAVLAVAVPSPIVLAGGSKTDDTKEVLERLEKMVKEVKGKVGEVKTQVDTLGASLGNVAREVADLKGEITPLKDLRLKIDLLDKSFANLKIELEDLRKSRSSTDKAGLEDVKDRLASIERTLAKMMQPETRTSLSPAATITGKIMLVNNYTDRLLFRINDRDFFVQSGQSQVVEGVPAGPFTYQVLAPNHGWQERQSRTLDPNRTFTLNAMLP